MSAQILHGLFFSILADGSVVPDSVKQVLGADVGSHDKDSVLEVHSPALRIRNTSVIQDLKQHVKDIRVSLLDLIEKNYRIRFTPYSFCQLATFFISDISGRCSDESGHGELLHVLTHINSDHVVLIIKERLCQRLGKLCLTNTGRSQEQE